ncbi:MAG: hypothetical protein AB7O98_04835 [Hyphomonadaceae bacterium]
MFGYVIDLSGFRSQMRRVADAQWRRFAGLAFMIVAMAAIEYDEFIAPEMSRLSDTWGGVATDLGRKLTSFTL